MLCKHVRLRLRRLVERVQRGAALDMISGYNATIKTIFLSYSSLSM